MHVELAGLRSRGARGLELRGARDVEGRNARRRQPLQHEGLAVGFHRIGRLAAKRREEGAGVLLQHRGAETVDRAIGPERERRVAGGLETSHLNEGTSPVAVAEAGRYHRGCGDPNTGATARLRRDEGTPCVADGSPWRRRLLDLGGTAAKTPRNSENRRGWMR